MSETMMYCKPKLLWALVPVVMLLAACDNGVGGPPPNLPGGGAAPPPVVAKKASKKEEYRRPETGGVPRRDPFFFEPPAPKEECRPGDPSCDDENAKDYATSAFPIRSLRLVAIVSGSARPKAMFIDGTGLGHIVEVDDRVGSEGGVVRDIRTNEVEVQTSAGRDDSGFADPLGEPDSNPDNAEESGTTIVIRLSDTELPPAESEESKDDDILKEIDKRPIEDEDAPNR